MFRRRFGHSANDRNFRPNFQNYDDEDLSSPSDWDIHHHFMFVYIAFKDLKYMEKGNTHYERVMESDIFQKETSMVTNSVMGWFPDIVLGMNEMISPEKLVKEYGKLIDYCIKIYDEENTPEFMSQFKSSLKEIKSHLNSSEDKLELVLEDLWDIAVIDKDLESREREMFIMSSEIFDIPVNLE